MSFSQMVKLLREENKEKILFINAGAFYIAVEEDAVLLNNKLQLKCSCFQKNTCKVGVPIASLEKYLKEIEKLEYGYIVYNFNKEQQNLEIIKEYKGKKKNKTVCTIYDRNNIFKCRRKRFTNRQLYLANVCKYIFK